MSSVQDLIITISISGILVLFLLSTFGSYSPTISNITQPHLASLNTTTSQMSDITDQMSSQTQLIEIDPNPLSALASALGGIAVLTISIGAYLLTTLISLPLIFMGLVFDLVQGGTTALAPDYQSVVEVLRNLTLIIVPTIIVVGLVFRMILSRPPEF